MKKPFFYVLFCFLSLPSFSQKKSIDSLLNVTGEANPKAYINAIISIPYDEAMVDIKSFQKLTERAIEKSETLGDQKLLAKSYLQKAIALHFTTKEEEALELTLKAINIFQSLNDRKNTASTYLNLGWKIKYRNLNDAFSYMKKGVLGLEAMGSEVDLVGAYNNFGVLYQMRNNPDSALYYHRKSLILSKKLKDSIGIPFAHTHIANVLLKQQNFEQAKKHLDTSLNIRTQKEDTYGMTDSFLYLGDLFFYKKEFSKAADYFQKGYVLSRENNYFPLKKYALEYLHKSYDSLKDYKQSLRYLKEFQSQKDSVLNKETNNRIEELQIEFSTLEKEKEIAEQKIIIQNRNFITTFLAASILILALIFWGIYRRNILRRQQLQKELELNTELAKIKTQNKLQEQRLEISRDLHDNIGSQLTFIISSIDNLKYVSKDINDKLKEKLANISSFTFDTIHQLRDTIWAMNKNQITYDEFYSRVLSYIEKAKTVKPEIEFEIKNTISSEVVFNSVEGMNLFRVVQESINNALKHANASTLYLEFTQQENNLRFTIKDDGNGFDLNTVEAGNGLSNIETRISSIKGKVFIESEKNKGTSISIKLTT